MGSDFERKMEELKYSLLVSLKMFEGILEQFKKMFFTSRSLI